MFLVGLCLCVLGVLQTHSIVPRQAFPALEKYCCDGDWLRFGAGGGLDFEIPLPVI